jgi:hypothetical protein
MPPITAKSEPMDPKLVRHLLRRHDRLTHREPTRYDRESIGLVFESLQRPVSNSTRFTTPRVRRPGASQNPWQLVPNTDAVRRVCVRGC